MPSGDKFGETGTHAVESPQMTGTRSSDAVRILYVEDDATSAKLVKAIAEKEGYLVTHAPNEKECWRAVAEEGPGLFLIHLTLPDGSGLDLMSKLREKHPTIPAIVVTASASIQDVIGPIQRRAAGYLTKPVHQRRPCGDAARRRAVRPGEGRLHGRRLAPPREVRTGRHRDDLPGRDRRHAPPDAGQNAPGPPGALVPARRRRRAHHRQRPRHLR